MSLKLRVIQSTASKEGKNPIRARYYKLTIELEQATPLMLCQTHRFTNNFNSLLYQKRRLLEGLNLRNVSQSSAPKSVCKLRAPSENLRHIKDASAASCFADSLIRS